MSIFNNKNKRIKALEEQIQKLNTNVNILHFSMNNKPLYEKDSIVCGCYKIIEVYPVEKIHSPDSTHAGKTIGSPYYTYEYTLFAFAHSRTEKEYDLIRLVERYNADKELKEKNEKIGESLEKIKECCAKNDKRISRNNWAVGSKGQGKTYQKKGADSEDTPSRPNHEIDDKGSPIIRIIENKTDGALVTVNEKELNEVIDNFIKSYGITISAKLKDKKKPTKKEIMEIGHLCAENIIKTLLHRW